jgi:hypothetical protein
MVSKQSPIQIETRLDEFASLTIAAFVRLLLHNRPAAIFHGCQTSVCAGLLTVRRLHHGNYNLNAQNLHPSLEQSMGRLAC